MVVIYIHDADDWKVRLLHQLIDDFLPGLEACQAVL